MLSSPLLVSRPSLPSRRCALALLLALAAGALAGPALAQPGFEKAFQPNSIAPGNVSVLVFTINTIEQGLATGLAFTDTLPAGVTIATPSFTTTTCDGTVSAPAGGSTITFSGGAIEAESTCEITVDVTSATPGTHMNVSGDLTSSAGNSGMASADLIVATDRPAFSKSFVDFAGSPISSLHLGSRARLVFTVDNSANASAIGSLSFTDVLPAGLEIADPAVATTDCGAALAAPAGGDTITLGVGGFVAAGASCSASVDVRAIGAGVQLNRSGNLTSFSASATRSSGIARDALDVVAGTVDVDKEFLDDPTPPGGAVVLRFTLRNFSRTETATGLTFTDDLDATLSGLAATSTPLVTPCGAGSLLAGTSLLTFTDGSLPPEGSCSFDVTLDVPAGTIPAAYPNVTSDLGGSLDGSPFVGDPASDVLYAVPAPRLEKSYVPTPIAAGDATAIEFTITNTSTTSAMSGGSFTDQLAFEPAGSVTGLPAGGFCGPGSTIFTSSIDAIPALLVSGANLAAGASCTFQVQLAIPAGFPQGSYVNVTSEITGTVDGETYVGDPAQGVLEVVGAPTLRKEFIDDPVEPGDQVTLRFTLELGAEAPLAATDIQFSDDLGAVLPGLEAAAGETPASDVCGAGSLLSGTTILSLTGGTLAPGESCTFDVVLEVPSGAAFGAFLNQVSDLQATVGGVVAEGAGASDELVVTAIAFEKSFLGDPVVPGETVDLEFSLQNLSPSAVATDITFTDNLGATLSGLAVSGALPATPCGPGSSIVGTTTLIVAGGELAAGASCTFTVTLLVPSGAAEGTYGNITSNLSATVAGSPVTMPPASDALEVDVPLSLTKEFTDDPALPGGTVTLEFTLTNADPADAITDIAFTDDLDAALSGLVAVGTPQADVCGAGSQLSGTSLLTLTGGNLVGGASCTFSVTLQLPDPVIGSPPFVNTTSTVSGTVNGIGISADPASDTLEVFLVAFTKSFDGPTTATGTATLTFTLTNLDAMAGIAQLAFTDDLGAVVPGLFATDTPRSDVCGNGSTITGTSFLTFSGGELAADDSCSFSVEVAVPAGVASGSYDNVTSELSSAGLPAASPATATLTIEPPPTFAKAFAPATVQVGTSSTLTFTIDNSASALAASALDFTDVLPAGLVVAAPAAASTTCTGGTLAGAPGSGTFGYSGGSVAAGASCTVEVDVVATSAGSFANTSGALTSTSGSSGTASDTLEAFDGELGVVKSFASDPVLQGGQVTLDFTISAASDTTDIGFTDDLDAMLTGLVAVDTPQADVCGAGSTLGGTSVLTLSGGSLAAGSSCSFAVTLAVPAGASPGTYDNLTSAVTGSVLGVPVSGAPASDELTVTFLAFAKAFAADPVDVGGSTVLTFTLDNPDPVNPITDLGFSDDLDAVYPGLVALGLPQSDVCGAGSTLSGTSVVTLAGGSLAAGGSCSFDVVVQLPADGADTGSFLNVTGPLTGRVGGVAVIGDGAETAEASLVVGGAVIAIPTLGEWGLGILATVLGLLAAARLGRRGRRGEAA